MSKKPIFAEVINSAPPITQQRINNLMAQRIGESMTKVSKAITELNETHEALSGLFDILTDTGEDGECHE